MKSPILVQANTEGSSSAIWPACIFDWMVYIGQHDVQRDLHNTGEGGHKNVRQYDEGLDCGTHRHVRFTSFIPYIWTLDPISP